MPPPPPPAPPLTLLVCGAPVSVLNPIEEELLLDRHKQQRGTCHDEPCLLLQPQYLLNFIFIPIYIILIITGFSRNHWVRMTQYNMPFLNYYLPG